MKKNQNEQLSLAYFKNDIDQLVASAGMLRSEMSWLNQVLFNMQDGVTKIPTLSKEIVELSQEIAKTFTELPKAIANYHDLLDRFVRYDGQLRGRIERFERAERDKPQSS